MTTAPLSRNMPTMRGLIVSTTLLALGSIAWAQPSPGPTILIFSTAPSGSCSPTNLGGVTADGSIYFCPANSRTWTKLASSGGAASASIGGAITGATDGSILFAHPAAVFAQDNANLSYNFDPTFQTLFLGPSTNATAGDARLIITDDNNNFNSAIDLRAFGSGNNPYMIFRAANGTLASPTALSNGNTIGQIFTSGYDGSGFTNNSVIAFVVNGSVSAGVVPIITKLNSPLSMLGSTLGAATIQVPASFTSYNFNLPTSPGTSGQALLSGGGGSSPMTWGSVPSGSGVANQITYWTGTNGIGGTTGLIIDPVTKHMGVGPATVAGNIARTILDVNETASDSTTATNHAINVNFQDTPSADVGAPVVGMPFTLQDASGNTHAWAGRALQLSSLHQGTGTTTFTHETIQITNSIVHAGGSGGMKGIELTNYVGQDGNSPYPTITGNGIFGATFSNTMGGTSTVSVATGAQDICMQTASGSTAGTLTTCIGHEVLKPIINGGSTLAITNNYGMMIRDQSGISSGDDFNIDSQGVSSLNLYEGTNRYKKITALSAPPSGFGNTWWDTTNDVFSGKNSAGTVSVTVVPDTGASNNFLTAISASGVISKAQPSLSSLSNASIVVVNNNTNTGTSAMTLDMSASSSAAAHRLPNIAGASSAVNGALSYDTTNNNIHGGGNGVDNIVVLAPSASLPTNGNCAQWVLVSNVLTLGQAAAACAAGGSGTVNSGTAGQFTYYAGTGTAVSGNAHLALTNSGATNEILTYQNTVASAATELQIKAGATQSTTHLTSWANNGGTEVAFIDATGNLQASTTITLFNTTGIGIDNATNFIAVGTAKSFTFSSTSAYSGAADASLMRGAVGRVDIGNGAGKNCTIASQCRDIMARSFIAGGAVPGISGCSAGTQVGGNTSGTFASGTTGTCTVILTFGTTAPNGWSCLVNDQTTPADLIGQTGSTTTTCTVSGTTISGDVLSFQARPF